MPEDVQCPAKKSSDPAALLPQQPGNGSSPSKARRLLTAPAVRQVRASPSVGPRALDESHSTQFTLRQPRQPPSRLLDRSLPLRGLTLGEGQGLPDLAMTRTGRRGVSEEPGLPVLAMRRLRQSEEPDVRRKRAPPPPPARICDAGDPFAKPGTGGCCQACKMAARKYSHFRDSDLDPSMLPPPSPNVCWQQMVFYNVDLFFSLPPAWQGSAKRIAIFCC